MFNLVNLLFSNVNFSHLTMGYKTFYDTITSLQVLTSSNNQMNYLGLSNWDLLRIGTLLPLFKCLIKTFSHQ